MARVRVPLTRPVSSASPRRLHVGNVLYRARTCAIALGWCFLCPLRCPSVLVNQAVDDVSVLDPGGHIDRFAGLAQRRSLFPRLVRPMLVIVPRVLGQSPPKVLFAVDQQVVQALVP